MMSISIVLRIIPVVLLVIMTSQVHAVELKIATLLPKRSKVMKKMRVGAKKVAQRTNKRVRIRFYPGGVMGDDKSVLRKIRFGKLHGGTVAGGSMSEFFSDSLVYSLPLKFKSLEEVDYVRGRMDQLMIDGLEKGGFVTLGLAGGGFAYVMSNAPIQSVNDLRKQKVWVPDNEAALEAVKAFGINPIPLSPADVRKGLQTGLIDTVITSPIGALVGRWHTQVKYMMEIPFLYLYVLLVVDQKEFAKISPPDQDVLRKVMGRTFRGIGQLNRKYNVKALDVLRKPDVQFVKPPTEALDEWYSWGSTASERLVKGDILSQGIVSTLEGYLKDYRSQKSQTQTNRNQDQRSNEDDRKHNAGGGGSLRWREMGSAGSFNPGTWAEPGADKNSRQWSLLYRRANHQRRMAHSCRVVDVGVGRGYQRRVDRPEHFGRPFDAHGARRRRCRLLLRGGCRLSL